MSRPAYGTELKLIDDLLELVSEHPPGSLQRRLERVVSEWCADHPGAYEGWTRERIADAEAKFREELDRHDAAAVDLSEHGETSAAKDLRRRFNEITANVGDNDHG